VSDVRARALRRYLIERELTSKAELDALVADDLEQAADYGDCPMRCLPIDPPAA
jgi:hypothetical protein